MIPSDAREIAFAATEAGCSEEYDVIVCGASNAEASADYHYVALQQWAEQADLPDDEERRIHFEIDDQINSDYGLVQACSLSRSEWRITLTEGVSWYPNARELVINLSGVAQPAWDALRTGLQRIFRDEPERLHEQPESI